MSIVPGDPASLSACAATARRVAADLGPRAEGIRSSGEALGETWPGRTSARVRHRGSILASATDETAEQLLRVGGVLQDHATELADLVARARTIGEQATAAGLEVRDGRVVVAFGVTGTADLHQARDRDEAQGRLQRDLDLVLAQHRRRRDWVLEVLKDSSTTLGRLSHGLRQG